MKRAIVAAVFGGLILGLAAPVSAAPSNKNSIEIQADCGGQEITINVVHHTNETADLVAANPLVGGGVAKVKTLTGFEPGTTNELFSLTSKYRGPTNATCTGTFSEGPDTFDFSVEVHLVGQG
jgi:hypothetical protein